MKKTIRTIVFLAVSFLCFQMGAQTLEGKGADTPEEAVKQYLSALKTCDYNKIISCYAVETFVEKYDIEEYIRKMNSATPIMKMINPKDKLLTQTAKYEVLDAITKTVKYQIWNLSDDNFFKDGKFLIVQDSPEALADKVFPSDAQKRLSKIKFTGEFIPSVNFFMYILIHDFNPDFSDYEDEIGDFTETSSRYYEKQKQIYGCDDLKDVSACFSIGDSKYYYLAETIKYGSKWYISPNQGYMASLIGLAVTSGCIANENEL